MTVDPKVYALAELFIDDLLRAYDYPAVHRPSIARKLAEAMQQAIEDECEAIEQELKQA